MEDEECTAERIVVTIAPGQGYAMLARDTLAQGFGIAGDAAERLLSGGGVLRSDRRAGGPCLALLRLLGVQADLMQDQGAPRHDLSLRLSDPRDPTLRLWLAECCPDVALSALDGVSGLVIADLTLEAARALTTALRRKPGVLVTSSAQNGALYDVFGPEGFEVPAALARYLSILGHGESATSAPLGRALASGIEARIAALITARFADLGLIAVNQAFQRFDLCVTGPGGLALREIADFLGVRGLRDAMAALERREPLVVEQGLTRAAARQFLNDYRHIGLCAEARLCRGAENR
ncbi:hypothetical protein [Stagnihabitans tardus]|uniref:Uncharacterized protein n=1 Tax=Stagnihabitans tardus TaxID=2699202 RepID=A0AAE4Y972_9RHOB|nr:hypothetical protein [Stagnihabitans tardus]NBZ88377.1 hypothetical protein [Stagnihabitans tardus]